MAGERQMANLGLVSFWDLGSDYKTGMDANLRTISVVAQMVAESRTDDLPVGSAGLVHIVKSDDGTHPNQIAVYDRTDENTPGWVYITPKEGWSAYIKDESAAVTYNGSEWVADAVLPTFGSGDAGDMVRVNAAGDGFEIVNDASRISSEAIASDTYQAVNEDFRGGVIKRFTSTTDATISVTQGVTNGEPLTIVQEGEGIITVVAGSGVTINSKDGALLSNGQYGAMTLIPVGLDSYLLVGDITA